MHTLNTLYFDVEAEEFRTKTVEKEVGVNDVLIKTTHSGLCYTDVHASRKDAG